MVIGEVLDRRWAADLAPLIEEYKPGVVIHDIATLGAPLAARVAGIPALGHGFGLFVHDNMSVSMVSAFTALAAESGVTDPERLLRTRVFDICPESVQSKEFAAGVPQLVLPIGADQFTNAAAKRLLSGGSVRKALRWLAAEIAAMPAPADVVAALPNLIP